MKTLPAGVVIAACETGMASAAMVRRQTKSRRMEERRSSSCREQEKRGSSLLRQAFNELLHISPNTFDSFTSCHILSSTPCLREVKLFMMTRTSIKGVFRFPAATFP